MEWHGVYSIGERSLTYDTAHEVCLRGADDVRLCGEDDVRLQPRHEGFELALILISASL